jgi:hypothetical protein
VRADGAGDISSQLGPLVAVDHRQEDPLPRRDECPRRRDRFGVIDHVDWRWFDVMKILLTRLSDTADVILTPLSACRIRTSPSWVGIRIALANPF